MILFEINEVQGQNYHPLIEKGKEWSIRYWNSDVIRGQTFWDGILKLSKDTVINGLRYSTDNLVAYREENKRVYCRLPFYTKNTDTLEHIIYDFNLKPKDTFIVWQKYKGVIDTMKLVVEIIDSIKLQDNEYHKRIIFQEIKVNRDIWCSFPWIEGIGNFGQPLYLYASSCQAFESWSQVCMVKTIEAKLYDAHCGSFGGVQDEEFLPLQLYPNPASTYVMLSQSFRSSAKHLVLTNSVGQIIQVVESPENVIDISSLPPGIYSLQLNQDGKQYAGRFIKQ